MKICFLGEVARALHGTTKGGGELQIALLAKVLAKAGNEVVIVDYGTTKDFEWDDGIKIVAISGWNKGIRYIRIFTHRFPKLYKTLKDQNADIYYCRIRDFRHIFSYLAARKVKAKFILGLASDLDVMSFKMRARHYYLSNIGRLWWLFSGILTEIIYPFLIHNSDYIFVQHQGQMNILKKKGISSVIFPNLINTDELPDAANPVRTDFIYVGSLDKRKGFVEFFEIISKTPELTYKVIGQPRDKTGYLFLEKLKSFRNVKLFGKLDHSETLFHIANSKALISTSPMEGFPNIFIEAWSYGIPVLSLYVDPGNIIKNEGLGYVADGSIDQLISYMRNNTFERMNTDYVNGNHGINQGKIKEIDLLFKSMI